MKVRFKRLDERAVPPTKADGDNAYDLYPVFDEDAVVILPGFSNKFDTMLSMELPEGHAMFICNRGSRGSVGLVYGAHVIDESYRGSIILDLHNISTYPIIVSDLSETVLFMDPEIGNLKRTYRNVTVIPKSKPLAQGAIIKTETVEWVESDELGDTERGSGSFGHTDNK